MNQEQLLWDKYIDGTLTNAELDAWVNELRHDPAALRHFMEMAEMDYALMEHFHESATPMPVLEIAPARDAEKHIHWWVTTGVLLVHAAAILLLSLFLTEPTPREIRGRSIFMTATPAPSLDRPPPVPDTRVAHQIIVAPEEIEQPARKDENHGILAESATALVHPDLPTLYSSNEITVPFSIEMKQNPALVQEQNISATNAAPPLLAHPPP